MTLKELGDSSFSTGAIDMLPVPADSSTCPGTGTEESALNTSGIGIGITFSWDLVDWIFSVSVKEI